MWRRASNLPLLPGKLEARRHEVGETTTLQQPGGSYFGADFSRMALTRSSNCSASLARFVLRSRAA